MDHTQLITQLYRSEFAKMVAVTGRLLGLQHIDVAEDIVSDTFLIAAEKWSDNSVPPNPEAWLYTVARNKTQDFLRRHNVFTGKIAPALKTENTAITDEDPFTDHAIRDSQLRMLFAVCHPAIAVEAQIALALRILCGLTVDEIAVAFFTNKETITKRLYRAKAKLNETGLSLEMPSDRTLPERMEGVLHIIYLLFNEGYRSSAGDSVLRKDLCLEALRLGILLTKYPATDLPATNALIALMCFHASRFDARDDTALYDDQDETLWDSELIKLGTYYLHLSAKGDKITRYHLEAAIARWHCTREDSHEKWDGILQLYNQLLQINYSPRIALNRTYAYYKVYGNDAALAEALKLKMESDHFYHALLGELYKTVNKARSKEHFQQALALARSEADRKIILIKLQNL